MRHHHQRKINQPGNRRDVALQVDRGPVRQAHRDHARCTEKRHRVAIRRRHCTKAYGGRAANPIACGFDTYKGRCEPEASTVTVAAPIVGSTECVELPSLCRSLHRTTRTMTTFVTSPPSSTPRATRSGV